MTQIALPKTIFTVNTAPYCRVVVVGCSGAGKSTFCNALSSRLDVPHVERDRLGELGSDVYRAAVDTVLSTPAWVFDGAPYYVEASVYGVAQAVIWLDYSRTVVVGRAIGRALRRTFGKSDFPDAPQSWWHHWFGAGSPWFAWKVYTARRHEFGGLASRSDLGQFTVIRFGSPAKAEEWLNQRT